jgi:hypothetical protein
MRLHPYIALPAATLVALASLAIVGPAHANIKDTKGRYVFGGNTYSKANFDKFSDPVTLIMRGGGGRITTGRVGRHMTDDWVRFGIRVRNPACKSPQYVPYPVPNRSSAVFARPAMYGSTNNACGNQHHLRYWNDVVHSNVWNHETSGNFMLASAHKERVFSCGFRVIGPAGIFLCEPHKHRISGDWDQARRYTLRAMRGVTGLRPGIERSHHVQNKWGVHPTARKWYRGKHHSRVISRVSMAHR